MLLHEIHLDVVRARNASKPNKERKIIRTGSEVSVNPVCSFRSCPKNIFHWLSSEFRSYSSCYTVSLDLISVVFPVRTHFMVATGGPPLATTKCVMATGGAAMGSAVATGGLPWVVSTGFQHLLRLLRGGG